MATRKTAVSPVPAFLSYGFRPFFLLGAAWAIAALAIVLAALAFRAALAPREIRPSDECVEHAFLDEAGLAGIDLYPQTRALRDVLRSVPKDV